MGWLCAADAAVCRVRCSALLLAFDGGERVVVLPHGQRQRASGLGLEQVVAAAEAGLSGDPGAVAGDVGRIEVLREVAVFGEAGDHRELLSVNGASVVGRAARPRRQGALYRSLYLVGWVAGRVHGRRVVCGRADRAGVRARGAGRGRRGGGLAGAAVPCWSRGRPGSARRVCWDSRVLRARGGRSARPVRHR